MSYTQGEKMEIIRMVENSDLPVKTTLEEFDVNWSSFYKWYRRYAEEGYEGLAARKPAVRKFWNRIPDHEKEQVVSLALEHPEKSPRELAWYVTDKCGFYLGIECLPYPEGLRSGSESGLHRSLSQRLVQEPDEESP